MPFYSGGMWRDGWPSRALWRPAERIQKKSRINNKQNKTKIGTRIRVPLRHLNEIQQHKRHQFIRSGFGTVRTVVFFSNDFELCRETEILSIFCSEPKKKWFQHATPSRRFVASFTSWSKWGTTQQQQQQQQQQQRRRQNALPVSYFFWLLLLLLLLQQYCVYLRLLAVCMCRKRPDGESEFYGRSFYRRHRKTTTRNRPVV